MTAPLQIGKYRVLRELGRGGMGVVYEGEHVEVRHHVAIKLLDQRYAEDPQILARFRNEGLAANLPRHPGIVQVLERGVSAQPEAPYIIMEYVDGEPVRHRLKAHPRGLPMPMLIRIGAQVAHAIAAAHKAQVIHRDIKPENVMLTLDAAARGGERAKVLDFGIAVIKHEKKEQLNISGSDTQIDTNPFGGFIGTVHYMAPEQWQGAGGGALDAKADVYQLGAMLYELLTGQPPFVAEEVVSIGYKHLNEAPKPLTERRAAISPELATLVHRMLAKKPAQRPTMVQVAETLDQLEALEAGASGSLSTSGLVVLRPRRELAIALAALVALVGLFIAHERWPSARQVTWQISSVPSGADILGPGGQSLGQTPWRKQQKQDVGKVPLTIRRSGYQDVTVYPDYGEDFSQTVKLPPGENRSP